MISQRDHLQNLLDHPDQYQPVNLESAKKFIEIANERIRRLTLIVNKLNSNLYLNPIEQTLMKQDQDLVEQLDQLGKQINKN